MRRQARKALAVASHRTCQALEQLESRMMLSIAEPNNSLSAPYAVNNGGHFSQKELFSDFVGASDTVDYYFISPDAAGKFSATLYNISTDVDLRLIEDKNHNYAIDSGEVIAQSLNTGTQTDRIENAQLTAPNYYFLEVKRFGSGDTNYALDLYLDTAGETPAGARQLIEGGANNYPEHLDGSDTVDVFHLNLAHPSANFQARILSSDGVNNFQAQLYGDYNHNGMLDSNELITTSGIIDGHVSIGSYPVHDDTDYYVKVTQSYFSSTNALQNYSLRVFLDYAGADLFHALHIGDVTDHLAVEHEEVGSFSIVTYTDPVDYYSITVSKSSTLNIELGLDGDFDPTIFNGTVELIRDANSSGTVDSGEVLSTKSTTLTTSTVFIKQNVTFGQYFIRVTGGPYPNYRLKVNADTSGGISYPGPKYSDSRSIGSLAGKTTINEAVGAGDASDTFKFTLSSAGNVFAKIGIGDINAIYGTVFQDKNNDGLVNNDESVGGFDNVTALDVNLPAGTYYLSLTGGEHNYSLLLIADLVGDGPAVAKNLGSLGAFASNSDYVGFATNYDTDYYKFNLTNTQTVTVSLLGDSGFNGDIFLYRDLDDGVGTLEQIQRVTGAGSSKFLQKSIPAGKYQVVIAATAGNGNYSVGFSTGDNDDSIPEANVTANNQKDIGANTDFSLASVSDVDMIRFTVDAGQTIAFDLDSRNSSSVNTYLRLFNSAGAQIAANDNSAAPGESASSFSYLLYTFGSPGTYYAGISSAGNNSYNPTTGGGDAGGSSTGDYRLVTTEIFDVTGTIAGFVYDDANGNGVKDAGESGIGGRTVYVDLDNDSVKDAGEVSTTTSSNGSYLFQNLDPGTHKVREIVPPGWSQTFPTSNFGISVSLGAGENVTGKNFLVKQNSVSAGGSISGFVYNDLDGDGVKDAGESGITGRQVFIDLDNDSALDAGEMAAMTNGSGQYTFSNLSAGAYKVRQVRPAGWIQTFPLNNYGISVVLATNQNATGKNFFTKQSAIAGGSISGYVFHDFNRDMMLGTGDTGLSGWTVYLDTDNDSVLDASEQKATTDATGKYVFSNLSAGTYKIRIVLQSGYIQTMPSSNFGNNATLTTGQTITGKNFGADN